MVGWGPARHVVRVVHSYPCIPAAADRLCMINAVAGQSREPPLSERFASVEIVAS
jgi:hypothetical protein